MNDHNERTQINQLLSSLLTTASPLIYNLGNNTFLIEYLGWSITISLDRIGRMKIQKIRNQIGYFDTINQHKSTQGDTQNLTFIRVDCGIVWMGQTPKIDIGISETGSYRRIVFTNNHPEIIDKINNVIDYHDS